MSVLYVSGDAAFARHVYETERRGYWSAALPLVLEKHGHLDLELAGPESLNEPESWSSHDAVLVARLAPEAWTEAVTADVLAAKTPLIVEGPLPPRLAQALGIRASTATIEDRILTVTEGELGRRASEVYGTFPGSAVATPSSRPVTREPQLDWTSIPRVPISAAHGAAWRAPGWDLELWHGVDAGSVIAQWSRGSPGNEEGPAIARFGLLTACSFGFFAYLGQAHTTQPTDGDEHRALPRLIGLEALLLALIDQACARAGRTRARLLPWPSGVRWVRSVRHDFDRPLSTTAVRQVLERHAAAGTAATWYWRSEPRRVARRSHPLAADLRPAKIVATAASQEVALHSELLWQDSEEEQGIVESAICRPVRGVTAHGGSNCFRFQGAPNVLWAEERGLSYTEALGLPHMHPHRFAALRDDGVIRPLKVFCPSHHVSFDLDMSRSNVEAVMEAVPSYIAVRGFMQLMNHPDINIEELFEALAAMPADGRADWTAARTIDWWRSTHVHGAIRIERAGAHVFRLTSRSDLDSIALELLAPDGTTEERAVTLKAGVPIVQAGSAAGNA